MFRFFISIATISIITLSLIRCTDREDVPSQKLKIDQPVLYQISMMIRRVIPRYSNEIEMIRIKENQPVSITAIDLLPNKKAAIAHLDIQLRYVSEKDENKLLNIDRQLEQLDDYPNYYIEKSQLHQDTIDLNGDQIAEIVRQSLDIKLDTNNYFLVSILSDEWEYYSADLAVNYDLVAEKLSITKQDSK